MEPCPHPAWIEIDLQQLAQNIAMVRQKIGARLFCMAVKANGYGHGLVQVANIAQAMGVDVLGVSCLKEAMTLRESGSTLPIFVFGAIHEDQIPQLIEQEFEFSISSHYKAVLVEKACAKLGRKCRVHLEIDTGMQRTGMRASTGVELFKILQASPHFEIRGIYSHLATADKPDDPFTRSQIAAFQTLVDQLSAKAPIRHLANSGGVMFYPESYFDMVRPGLLCYGYFPNGQIDSEGKIAPCFSLKAKVSYFKVVPAHTGISYGHLYHTKAQTRIVTVPIGYGDGYPRALSNMGHVLIRGKKYQISGAICMDQFMVDVGMDEVYVGDEVVLIGKQGSEEIRLLDVAHAARTIPYEILCSLNERLSRVYLV